MLLQYVLLASQTPMQAGMPTTLTLEVSNGGRQLVQVTNVVITLPIGTNAKDLTADTSFQTETDSGWGIAQSAGQLTFTPPPGGGTVGSTGIVITIANVAVNDQPGTANISIAETAAVGGSAPTTSYTSLPVAKFPVQFSVSDLSVTPTEVPYGGSASVMWTGTQAEGATYTLDYADAPSHPINVANIGPYQANNMTSFPEVFTLTVSLTVPGQDQPLTVQKQAAVSETPQLGISQFTGSQPTMAAATPPLRLQWQVQLATSLTLALSQPSGSVDVTGHSGCIVSANGSPPLVISDLSGNQIGTLTPPSPFPASLDFVLTASDGTSFVQRDVQIQVLIPAITQFYSWAGGMTWTTANANPVTIDWGVGTVGTSGYLNNLPSGTYTLTAVGFGATATGSQFVPILYPPSRGPRGCLLAVS
jgi:hypothetical protein